jgi:DNA-binding response OmpR family regulator
MDRPTTRSVQTATSDARRLLIMSNDTPIARVVDLSLSHAHFVRRLEQNLSAARTAIEGWQPDLLVVYSGDSEWQDLVGRTVEGRRLPVIVLTRRSDVGTKLMAFERGADDFLVVPFNPDELVARCTAVIRRAYGESVPLIPTLKIGDLEVNLVTRRVRHGADELHLTALEQALLYVLAANAGAVLTRDQIVDAVWGAEHVPSSNVVDRHVRALRLKLRNHMHKDRYIETVHGVGYRFLPALEATVP